MKSIVRVVHLPSVVKSEFYNATRILFVCKENKNNNYLSTERKQRTLFCISRAARMQRFRSDQSINTHRIRILVLRLIQKSVRILRSVDNLYNGTTVTWRDREETNCCYFYFLCIQKVFSSHYKIQIEPLMADGLPWRCFSYFSGPWQW